MWYAARKGHENVQLLFEQNGVDPNGTDDQVNGRTPLMVAAWNGHEKVVQVLLGKNNVNPNIPDKRGEAPLWCAAWFGRHCRKVAPEKGRHQCRPQK